jgi:hypothetical protein
MGMAGDAKKAISDVRAAALPGECRTKFRQARLQLRRRDDAPLAPRTVLGVQTGAAALLDFLSEIFHGWWRNGSAFSAR